MNELQHLSQFRVRSFSQPRCSQLQKKRWFTHWLAKPCSVLWPQHLKNSNSVSDMGPQVMALMDCHKHEQWNTQIGSFRYHFPPSPCLSRYKRAFERQLEPSLHGWTNIFHDSELLSFQVSDFFTATFPSKKTPHGLFLPWLSYTWLPW